jgi:two-component system response regulator FixJ
MVGENPRTDKLILHFVGGNALERTRFAQIATLLGHHCEVYDNFDEVAVHPPRRGLMFIHDEVETGGIAAGFERLDRLGIWLPVIAIGEAPSPSQIVQSIKAGALDYIALPVEAQRLERCLARNAGEAERNAILRRQKVDARSKLDRLSRRESEVLELLANGCSNKLMARELGISPRTVEIHRANMMNKIGASSAATAMRLKLAADGR